MKEETIAKISEAVRQKYGEMVSVTNVVQFLFESGVATWDGFRNYYIKEKHREAKEENPNKSDAAIFHDLAAEFDMSIGAMRYIIHKEKY